MPEILQYDFMIRALVSGLLVAVTLPLLGAFLVARRYALIADSLTHVSLAGIGLGLVVGASPMYVAVPIAVLGALLIEYLRQSRRLSGDTALAVLMSGGLAVAVVLAAAAKGARTDFNSYLFGSISTTQVFDVWVLAGAAIVTWIVVGLNYRSLLHATFDEDSARIAGIRVGILNYLLISLTAVMVVLGMRIVGGLLLSALLVVPVLAAGRIARSFRTTQLLATIFAVIAVVLGLVAAFYGGVPAGGAIVLAAILLFVITSLLAP